MSDLGRQLVRLQVHKLHGLIALLLVNLHTRCSGVLAAMWNVALCFIPFHFFWQSVRFTRVWGRLFHELLTFVAKHG